MIRYYCDICSNEVTPEEVRERVVGKFDRLTVEIIAKLDNTWNAGIVCRECIYKAIDASKKTPPPVEPTMPMERREMENKHEEGARLAEIAKKFEDALNDNFNPSAREVGRYWVERLREEEARADLHATLNRKVADALGLSFGSDWAQLPKLVASLRAEVERLRGALRRLYDPAKIASVQIVCMGGDELCDPCINRERLCEALAEVKTILEGQDDRAPE